MFGAFKPTAPLSGGLLWYGNLHLQEDARDAHKICRKIPWRLSPPQKLRHRRRLRRVDNVVTVLQTALQRSAASQIPQPNQKTQSRKSPPPEVPQEQKSRGTADVKDMQKTLEGSQMVNKESTPHSISERRHGRGPREGEFVPAQTETPSSAPTRTSKLLAEEAAQNKSIKLIERWKAEMPTEQEMLPRNKYFMFDKKVRGYRKGVHKLPKWTRVSQRLNPPGF